MKVEQLTYADVTQGLCRELLPYVEECPTFGYKLTHPFMIELFLHPYVNERCNIRYREMSKYADKMWREGQYHRWLFMHERPFRFDKYLTKIHMQIDPEMDAKLLLDIWVDCEHPHINRYMWHDSFDRLKDTNHFKQSKAELEFPLTVYRGFGCAHDDNLEDLANSLSWTTDKSRAEWFATRFAEQHDQAVVATYVVTDPDEIFTVSNQRNEQEVVMTVDIWGEIRDYDFEYL